MGDTHGMGVVGSVHSHRTCHAAAAAVVVEVVVEVGVGVGRVPRWVVYSCGGTNHAETSEANTAHAAGCDFPDSVTCAETIKGKCVSSRVINYSGMACKQLSVVDEQVR